MAISTLYTVYRAECKCGRIQDVAISKIQEDLVKMALLEFIDLQFRTQGWHIDNTTDDTLCPFCNEKYIRQRDLM